ncbi:MAG: T9SS type A sorting domain-containing protein [Candidatus Cloacimonetes bacterium]|nr:T9SS type A sorting domain-containing protein [Candidatus Cloacimonadota bacterium]
MKKILMILFSLFFVTYLYSAIYVPGTHNDWDLDSSNEAYLKSNLGSTDYYGITIQPSVDGEFKIADGSWDYTWGGGYWIPGVGHFDTRWTIASGGNNAEWNGDNISELKSYVHLCIEKPSDYHSMNIPVGIMTLSSAPISINDVDFTYNGNGSDATVDVTLSGNKCAEEKIYVRYTDNAGSWANDGFALASGSGTSYSATIPGSAVSTSTQFYVLTTTVTSTGSSDLDNYPDLMTINYSNNGGSFWTLPVELSTFTAQYINNTPTLYWTTQSETDNMGWLVYRNSKEDFTSATQLSDMIEGHGTTTQQQSYIYEDIITNPQVGDVYYYWLESIDYSGTVHHYNRVAIITIPDINDPQNGNTTPVMYDLFASPNPFADATEIKFILNQSASVDVQVYDIRGAMVKDFDTKHVTADQEIVIPWDGKDNSAKILANGIYFYSLVVNGNNYTTKKIIIMK